MAHQEEEWGMECANVCGRKSIFLNQFQWQGRAGMTISQSVVQTPVRQFAFLSHGFLPNGFFVF